MATGTRYGNQVQVSMYLTPELYKVFNDLALDNGGASRTGRLIMMHVQQLMNLPNRIYLENQAKRLGFDNIFDTADDIIRDKVKEQTRKFEGGEC